MDKSLEDIRNDFPLIKNSDIAYLDSGATSQKPQEVIDAINRYYNEYNANAHRGTYDLSQRATEIYETTRRRVATFLNANSEREIIFSKNATESLNLIAYSYGLSTLKKDDEVVLSIMEHHSNLVPWQMVTKKTESALKYMYINDNFELDEKEIEEKITDKTKVVGITHVSNVLGTINNVKKVIEVAHKHAAVVVVDASQSIPHMEIDVKDLDCDFLVFSGHKMMSPMGVGVLYGKEELLKKMPPFLMGGDMIQYVYENDTIYAELPNKFEAGTQNVEAVMGLHSAIDYILSIGYDRIKQIEDEVVGYAIMKLKELGFVELYMTNNRENHQGVISFNVKGVHSHDVASILNSYGVCVRSGNHCAQPLMSYIKVDSTCRASFYMYNNKEDVDRLVEGLNAIYQKFQKFIDKN